MKTAEIIDDLIVLAFFLYFTLLVSGILKLKADRQERFDALMKRWGNLLRVIAYAGTAIFLLLIILQIIASRRP
jgi:hypothetical protein